MLVTTISLTIPKSDRIAIIGGWFGKRFADNSKYFYLHVNANLIKLGFDKVVWITKSKLIREELIANGYPAYSAWSLRSIFYHLRAKYHFIDQSQTDINPFFSIRSKRINLWHGFPLKKIGFYESQKPLKTESKITKLFNKLTSIGFWADFHLLATSKFSAEILGKAFRVDGSKVIISGYPRNYGTYCENPILYISHFEKESYENIKKYKKKGYKIIGYFPTFRDKKKSLLFGTENIEEISRFLDYCDSVKIKFVVKFHFADKDDNFHNFENHKVLMNLPSEADVYSFIAQLDILMTDYSSLYFDFLLWNRPILFFPYDLEYYRETDRGLIFDYDEFTPGPKFYNIEELMGFLSQEIETIKNWYSREYSVLSDELREKVFGDYVDLDLSHLISQIRK
jgi:CDP-glycerol glycerophosphotransferase